MSDRRETFLLFFIRSVEIFDRFNDSQYHDLVGRAPGVLYTLLPDDESVFTTITRVTRVQAAFVTLHFAQDGDDRHLEI